MPQDALPASADDTHHVRSDVSENLYKEGEYCNTCHCRSLQRAEDRIQLDTTSWLPGFEDREDRAARNLRMRPSTPSDIPLKSGVQCRMSALSALSDQ